VPAGLNEQPQGVPGRAVYRVVFNEQFAPALARAPPAFHASENSHEFCGKAEFAWRPASRARAAGDSARLASAGRPLAGRIFVPRAASRRALFADHAAAGETFKCIEIR